MVKGSCLVPSGGQQAPFELPHALLWQYSGLVEYSAQQQSYILPYKTLVSYDTRYRLITHLLHIHVVVYCLDIVKVELVVDALLLQPLEIGALLL